MSSSDIKRPIYFAVKLSQNNFSHHKTLCQLKDKLKNVIAITFFDHVR